jgi:Trk K+ transport system NAD-binding subunit
VSALAAPLLALTATTGDVLAAFPVGDSQRQVAEVTVAADSKLIGRPVAELDAQGRYLLLAHEPAGQPPRLLLDIDPQAAVAAGDRLVVAGRPADVRRLLEPGWDDLSDVLWAGRVRRFGRVAYRTLAEVDLPVKVATLTLLGVVAASAATYHYAVGLPWADGLYRTISVISTGAELGGEGYDEGGKVFVSALRMFGTLMVAGFTAIFTNYLLRARLGGAFEVRRIPDRGHVVVIGLGNVGYRVVEELVRAGERVVVVERRADGPFVPTCRRKGVPVVVGDATVKETLLQARAREARAVIAATKEDLVNLEIALLVAELNDKQRVVVRLGDSVLAETARTAAGVRMALSLPDLAAPAFVAGLLGDRVLAMFLARGRMLAAVEIAAQADDARLLGRSLRALAIDYGILPVAVVGPDGVERPADLGYRLAEVDRLTAVATLPDLDRVTRRVAVAADWGVEVLSYPLSARDGLALQARTLRNLTADEAESLAAGPPFLLADRQTRGQAEELLALLHREKVSARLVRADGKR